MIERAEIERALWIVDCSVTNFVTTMKYQFPIHLVSSIIGRKTPGWDICVNLKLGFKIVFILF